MSNCTSDIVLPHEKSSLILIKVLCTLLIALLGVASPLSLLADAIFPCTQQDQPVSRYIFVDESIHTDMAGHNGHDSTQAASLHHDGSQSSDSSATECECCVSCIAACASSAGSHGAIGSDSLDTLLANQSQLTPAAKTIHGNSDPISLFRPPKPNA